MKESPAIKDIMTVNPYAVKLNTSISEMINVMEEKNFDHLPVLDEVGHLKGIITKSDIYKKVLSLSKTTSGKSYSERMINNTTAQELMTLDPTFITTDQNLEVAIQVFYNADFHALPVLESNRLVGIVTCKDILATLNDMQFNQM